MGFQGCSDVVGSRVEHVFSMPKAAGMQLYFGFGTALARSPFGDAPTSDNDSPRQVGISIDEFDDLSIDRHQREKSESRRLVPDL
jgi:hypothetical protein